MLENKKEYRHLVKCLGVPRRRGRWEGRGHHRPKPGDSPADALSPSTGKEEALQSLNKKSPWASDNRGNGERNGWVPVDKVPGPMAAGESVPKPSRMTVPLRVPELDARRHKPVDRFLALDRRPHELRRASCL